MAFKIQDTTVIDNDRNAFLKNFGDVRQPTNISPPNNETNVAITVTLTSSPFFSLYDDAHANSQFQVANTINFSDIFYDSGNVAASNTNTVSFNLDIDSEYYWRVRYKSSANVFSEFSDTTSFTTANAFISTPTLEVSGAPDAVIETPTLTTGSFTVVGDVGSANVAHESTDWQVIRTSNSQIVFERLANTVSLTSIVVPAATLEANVQYEFKARHNANVFGSSAFASNTGTTVVSFNPTVLGESFGGGFYTGTIDIGGGVCYYLIVAPNTTGCACCRWKIPPNSTTPGSESFVNGFTNTYPPLANATHPAGNWTATRTIAGFTDWYLPAKNELNVLYTNKGSMPAGEEYSALYWSSSQCNTNCAYSHNFNTNSVIFQNKVYTYNKVRAVRRIPI